MPRYPSFLLKIKITILYISFSLNSEEGVQTLFTGQRERERCIHEQAKIARAVEIIVYYDIYGRNMDKLRSRGAPWTNFSV